MLDFDDGVRDLVKRIDNVTIQLAGLFCSLENELLELYNLCGSGNERINQGIKKSEFIEGMKELLKNSLLNNQENIDDEYLIALDNSVISLETLTSALVGTKCYVNCKVVNENEGGDDSEGISNSLGDCNELVLSEINENSSLIRLCRSVNRLTKHRNKIEKYDVEMNNELDKIKSDKTRELENKLKEMEIKLRSKEALCYAHEKQIEYLKCDLKELSKTNNEIIPQINIQELNIGQDQEFEQYIKTDNEQSLCQSPRDELGIYFGSDEKIECIYVNENIKKENENKITPLKLEPITNFNQVINCQNNRKYDNSSLQETFREEDLGILELKDQIQILNLDLQYLKEENSRLKLQLENTTNDYSVLPEKNILDESEVLYDILVNNSFSEKYTETDIEIFNNKQVVFKNIEKIINISIINSFPKLKKTELKKVEISNINKINTLPIRQNPKPCLVMWEPIIDCPSDLSSGLNTNHNIIPLPMSSYGQFRKSRRDGKKNPATIIEENTRTRKTVPINRNSFYCDLEKIIKKNTRKQES
ncbi:Uncharacterized protein GY17_00001885 [Cryptosporidium hominis]|uniref:Shugoshin C-terminal domain-containing protein n=2 Tax=Cryptosporidium hominis TaxID=237895 RepID=A0ABX5BE59_CRYHO|nr:Uncharacterized protein GY17_00001885 [Cryptosporidium hominis]|eukprot:PPS94791.1 Uncharacterized protein GY17_00001885 [Cryptosporidium hominis]